MTKRVAYVRCSREWLSEYLFKDKKAQQFAYWFYYNAPIIQFNKAPRELKVVGVEYRTVYDAFNIVFESPDFEEVLDDAVVPQIVPVFQEWEE